MTLPRRRRSRLGSRRSLVIALWVNAAVLAAILLAVLGRGNLFSSTASGAPAMSPPIAGGGGRFVMPAQFTMNTWGCYLLDIDNETLCAYQWFPGEHQLRLAAARNFSNDVKLKNDNTFPPPDEIKNMIDLEHNAAREQPATPPPGQPGNN